MWKYVCFENNIINCSVNPNKLGRVQLFPVLRDMMLLNISNHNYQVNKYVNYYKSLTLLDVMHYTRLLWNLPQTKHKHRSSELWLPQNSKIQQTLKNLQDKWTFIINTVLSCLKTRYITLNLKMYSLNAVSRKASL